MATSLLVRRDEKFTTSNSLVRAVIPNIETITDSGVLPPGSVAVSDSSISPTTLAKQMYYSDGLNWHELAVVGSTSPYIIYDSRTAYVSPTYGDDTTGTVGRPDLPFETTLAANTALALLPAGDPVQLYLRRDTYTIADENLVSTDNIQVYVEPGSEINLTLSPTWTAPTSNPTINFIGSTITVTGGEALTLIDVNLVGTLVTGNTLIVQSLLHSPLIDVKDIDMDALALQTPDAPEEVSNIQVRVQNLTVDTLDIGNNNVINTDIDVTVQYLASHTDATPVAVTVYGCENGAVVRVKGDVAILGVGGLTNHVLFGVTNHHTEGRILWEFANTSLDGGTAITTGIDAEISMSFGHYTPSATGTFGLQISLGHIRIYDTWVPLSSAGRTAGYFTTTNWGDVAGQSRLDFENCTFTLSSTGGTTLATAASDEAWIRMFDSQWISTVDTTPLSIGSANKTQFYCRGCIFQANGAVGLALQGSNTSKFVLASSHAEDVAGGDGASYDATTGARTSFIHGSSVYATAAGGENVAPDVLDAIASIFFIQQR